MASAQRERRRAAAAPRRRRDLRAADPHWSRSLAYRTPSPRASAVRSLRTARAGPARPRDCTGQPGLPRSSSPRSARRRQPRSGVRGKDGLVEPAAAPPTSTRCGVDMLAHARERVQQQGHVLARFERADEHSVRFVEWEPNRAASGGNASYGCGREGRTRPPRGRPARALGRARASAPRRMRCAARPRSRVVHARTLSPVAA